MDNLTLSALTGGHDDFRGACDHLDMTAFDHRVQGKGGPCFTLAPMAMTAMDEHWRGGYRIAYLSTTASALLSPLCLFLHQTPLHVNVQFLFHYVEICLNSVCGSPYIDPAI